MCSLSTVSDRAMEEVHIKHFCHYNKTNFTVIPNSVQSLTRNGLEMKLVFIKVDPPKKCNIIRFNN